MNSAPERVVILTSDLYPIDAVRIALQAFKGQVGAEPIRPHLGLEGDAIVLALDRLPGAPLAAVDDLLNAMLQQALQAHLGRGSEASTLLPRGL